MLIDFTVENFRSIKDSITLSTIAQSRKSSPIKPSKRSKVKPDYEIAPTFHMEGRNLDLLPVIGIFGANASGKSNVIGALDRFLLFIKRGSIPEKIHLHWFAPFSLSDSTKESPTRFELRVFQDNTIFIYTLALNRTRILQEQLEYILPPPSRMRNRLLFERLWDKDAAAYIYTNGKDFGNAYNEIQKSLREYEPFMSLLATRLNVGITEPFVRWLNRSLSGVSLGMEKIEYELAAEFLQKGLSSMLEAVTQAVRHFDTGVSKIEIESVKTEDGDKGEKFNVWVFHETDGKQVRWLMEEESTGTQRLFSLTLRILVTFYTGGVLLIDELGSNIHPNITRAIVRMFQSEKLNPKRAQLIFTSHDNTLQRGNLLRRDQIWFTQKRADGSTELYSLSDFRPRNDLAIDKAYLDGRFGAVPILPDEEELLEPVGSVK